MGCGDPQACELVFVVGPAVDGGGSLLVEEADLSFEVGDAGLGFEKGGGRFEDDAAGGAGMLL